MAGAGIGREDRCVRLPGPRHCAFLLARATLRSLGARPATAVLIMGHMRAGSTLLTHVLLGHPDLIGCGERNAAYRSTTDLDKLEIASRMHRRAGLRRVRYAVDQVNHDLLTPEPGLLADERVRCIFLIRDPDPTIRSILELTRRYYEPWSEARAEDYYVSRLGTLARHADIIGRDRLVALTYGELVTQTQSALRRIESFLGLESPLHERYALQKFTGVRGDPAEKILSGRIQHADSIPGQAGQGKESPRASAAYKACSETLRIGTRQPAQP